MYLPEHAALDAKVCKNFSVQDKLKIVAILVKYKLNTSIEYGYLIFLYKIKYMRLKACAIWKYRSESYLLWSYYTLFTFTAQYYSYAPVVNMWMCLFCLFFILYIWFETPFLIGTPCLHLFKLFSFFVFYGQRYTSEDVVCKL